MRGVGAAYACGLRMHGMLGARQRGAGAIPPRPKGVSITVWRMRTRETHPQIHARTSKGIVERRNVRRVHPPPLAAAAGVAAAVDDVVAVLTAYVLVEYVGAGVRAAGCCAGCCVVCCAVGVGAGGAYVW